MNRMGATAALKPSTSDEKQRQKLLWCSLSMFYIVTDGSLMPQLLVHSIAIVSMQGLLAAPELPPLAHYFVMVTPAL